MKTTEEIIDQRVAEFKAQLLKELTPKVEFEVGKWYKDKEYNNLLCYAQGIKGGSIKGFGVGAFGNWQDECVFFPLQDAIPATESEIKEALWNQFKKLGGKKGVKVERDLSFVNQSGEAITNKVVLIDSESYQYYPEQDILQVAEFTVYCKGKFATIVKEEAIKIGGYVLQVKDGSAVFGCKRFKKDSLTYLAEMMRNNGFDSVSFDDHNAVSLETINAILEKLK